MKSKGIVFCAVMVCLLYSASMAETYLNLELENQKSNSDSHVLYDSKDSLIDAYQDDLVMGYFIAAVPGFFVHGAGNMYAGKETRGLILLGVEAASIAAFYLTAIYGIGSEPNEDTGIGYSIIAAASLGLFLGSWIWDIATVGSAIKERHTEAFQFGIEVFPTSEEKNRNKILGIKIGVRF